MVWSLQTPTLEKVVNKKNGKIILAKINVDENGIAAQLNIQSILTVYGFVEEQVDAFQGAQPESKIEIMVDKMIDATPGNETPKLVNEANQLFQEQKFDESLTVYEKLVGIDPGNPKIIVGLLRCLIQLKRFQEAQEMFESFDDDILKNDEITKIKKLLDNSKNEISESSRENLQEKVNMNPQDKDLRYELAKSYLSSNETKKGFDELLKIFDKIPNGMIVLPKNF